MHQLWQYIVRSALGKVSPLDTNSMNGIEKACKCFKAKYWFGKCESCLFGYFKINVQHSDLLKQCVYLKIVR